MTQNLVFYLRKPDIMSKRYILIIKGLTPPFTGVLKGEVRYEV